MLKLKLQQTKLIYKKCSIEVLRNHVRIYVHVRVCLAVRQKYNKMQYCYSIFRHFKMKTSTLFRQMDIILL